MGIVFRQSVKTSIVTLCGAILGAAIMWLSTKYVPQQQYGFINTFIRWAVLFSVFTPFGLNNTLAVFIHRYNNENSKRKMLLAICLIFPLIATVLLSIVYFLFPTWLLQHFQPIDKPLMQRFYFWLPIYTLLVVYMTMLEQYLCSQMKVAISAFMREVLLRLLNIALIIFFGLKYIGFSTLIIGTVLSYLIPILIFLLISFKTKSFGISIKLNSFTKSEYKEIIHFSWYHYLLNMSLMLIGFMDSLLIPFYDHKGLSIVAVYIVALYFVSFVYMPSKAFMQASYAAFAKSYAENDKKKTKDLFARSSINLLIPTVCIALIMCCNLDNAVAILGSGKNYSGIIPVFLVLLIGQMINVATGMNDQILSITNYYKFNFYTSIGMAVILYFLIRLLVPVYSILGAAWASTATLVTYNFLKFYFIWKKTGMQPFSSKTILIFIAAVPALLAGYFFPYFFEVGRHIYIHTFIDATIRSSIIIVIYVIMLFWLKPSKDLEDYIATIKKDKRLF